MVFRKDTDNFTFRNLQVTNTSINLVGTFTYIDEKCKFVCRIVLVGFQTQSTWVTFAHLITSQPTMAGFHVIGICCVKNAVGERAPGAN